MGASQERCVSIGVTLRRVVELRARAERRTVSAQVVYLALLALDAPRQPGLEDERSLDHNPCPADDPAHRVMVNAEVEFWARVDARAKRMGESRSEAVRTLVLGGLAIADTMMGRRR